MPEHIQSPFRRRLIAFARDFVADKPALRIFLRDARAWLWNKRSRKGAKEDRGSFSPLVTAIVPNFNHARYLPKRLDSILQQTYGPVEILILDDASTDDSADVIRRYLDANPDRIRVRWSEVNSGNPFRQWQKGIAEATGELIWICESDDFADTDFLDRLVSAFIDESVMIAFGAIQFADADGRPYPGLDQYRERAQPRIWSAKTVRPAKAWFDTAFGVSNVIANVGGCLIRNQPIEPEIWETASTYRVLGDWYLYAMLSRGGQIAYVPGAVAWFRQHQANTSVSAFGSALYYQEHERLIRLLRQRWGVSDATVAQFEANLIAQFEYAKAAEDLGALSDYFDLRSVLAEGRRTRHILIVFLGFFLGGGELFPIHLANELMKKGLLVSVMTLKSDGWNDRIRGSLDSRIAVYSPLHCRGGVSDFIRNAGIDLVHSHFVGAEDLFFSDSKDVPDVAYVATLHGSYESICQTRRFIIKIARHVSHWVYLTEKNLDHLKVLDAADRDLVSSSTIPNAMPMDPRPFGQTRNELGIDDGDFVFALVSRALPAKGWEIAIRALELARDRTARRLMLLLCGTGEEADRLSARYGDRPNIRFLGFQDRIHGLYRLADCAVLPTRFPGESFPLTIIQALQVGRPVIATDIGEIARMLAQGGNAGGIVLPCERDDNTFASVLADAMVAMEDPATHRMHSEAAAELGRHYSMDAVADAYRACYEATIRRHRDRTDQPKPAG